MNAKERTEKIVELFQDELDIPTYIIPRMCEQIQEAMDEAYIEGVSSRVSLALNPQGETVPADFASYNYVIGWNEAIEKAVEYIGAEEGLFRLAEQIRSLKKESK